MQTVVEDVVPVLPAGIYPAVFTKISEESNDSGTYWLWTFTARNGDEDVEVTGTTSPRVTPRTKAAKWLTGLGAEVSVGSGIDFDLLYDTPVQLVIVINDTGYSRIDNVLPYPVSAPTKAAGKSK